MSNLFRQSCRKHQTLALTVSAALFGFLPLPASFAQEGDARADNTVIEEVMVTGSRIRRQDERSASPVQTLSEEDLRIDGSLTLGETLQHLPSVGSSLNSNGSAGTSHGTRSLNLRSLGANRSLILVNGHRWVNGSGTRGFRDFVDINTIPQVMIESVEVLQDGATAIYGADAIAGVVNMRTYQNFEGGRVRAYSGISNEGDRETYSAELLVGKNLGNSNWMLAVSYLKEEPIFTQDRDISAFPLNGVANATPEGLFRESGLAGVVGFTVPSLGITRDPGTDGSNLANWRPATSADAFNRYANNYLVAPLALTSVYLQNRTEFGNAMALRLEALFNRRESDQLFNGATPVIRGSRGFSIPNDPRVNPFGIAFGGSDFRIENYFEDVGQRDNVQEVDTYRIGVGLEGDLSNGWFWDSFLSFAKNEATFTSLNQIDLDRLALGLRACDATGITANVSDLLTGCVPVNMFNPLTPAMTDYIRFTSQDNNQAEQTDFTLNITGDLIELPAGPLAFAAGYEYRKEKGLDKPEPYNSMTPRVNSYRASSSAARDGTDGQYDLNEVYVEFDIPVLSDRSGVEDFRIQLATRYSDYSTFGSTTSSKAGFIYRPVDSLMLRGTWAEGFRSPSIVEQFEGLRETSVPVLDPCSNNGGNPALPGCAGVPATYTQVTSNAPTTVGGNPDLEPETSDNLSFGLVFTPATIANASLTIDWFNIKVDDTISAYGAQNLLNLCASSGQRCNFISRESSGELLNVNDGPINLNSTEVKGYDIVGRYLFDGGNAGIFDITVSLSRLLDYTTVSTLTNGALLVEEKTGTSALREAYPKWRALTNVKWNSNQWSALYSWRYIDGTVEQASGTDRNISSISYHNLSGSYQFRDSWSFRVGVDNIFDRQPPSSLTNTNINFDISTYNAIGRFFYGQVTWEFGS
ncbi:MAG: TonB-dependent receptor domain-containing protein [Pseudomonadota bacterium]